MTSTKLDSHSQKWIKQGRGSSVSNDYRPWLAVRDVFFNAFDFKFTYRHYKNAPFFGSQLKYTVVSNIYSNNQLSGIYCSDNKTSNSSSIAD